MPHTAGEMSFLQDRAGGTSRGLVRDVAAEQALVSLGPAGSGAPLHIHADAVNAAAFGRKVGAARVGARGRRLQRRRLRQLGVD